MAPHLGGRLCTVECLEVLTNNDWQDAGTQVNIRGQVQVGINFSFHHRHCDELLLLMRVFQGCILYPVGYRYDVYPGDPKAVDLRKRTSLQGSVSTTGARRPRPTVNPGFIGPYSDPASAFRDGIRLASFCSPIEFGIS